MVIREKANSKYAMQALKQVRHEFLTEKVIKALAYNNITNILEFIQEDSEKISVITKCSLPEVLHFRNNLISLFSASLLSGSTLLLKNVTSKKITASGIIRLDNMLNGGFPVGYMSELCGLADSGKTQLCLQMAINLVRSDRTVLYIDTKGDFSAVRIQKILDFSGFSHKDMAKIMFQIKVVHIWSMDEMIQLLKKLKNKTLCIDNLDLIIIDSLPCLMFQFLGDETKIGLSMLNTMVNYIRFLCKELDISVLCVNLQTRWLEQDIIDVDDNEETSLSTLSKENIVEKRNRCLGKYWHHIPALVLIVDKVQNKDTTQIKITISRNSFGKTGSCLLSLTHLGVT